ncbi:hypothetical protein OS493_039690 [Desmophyllum pertusum]|uniref:DUF4773 domain-containing protein n=1 Tax=Desmophyllum pertusum TaxID=174260 RepID=A0A9X0D607_9CNID|nr:hypothetical protein OS493_039690 [Desmophyllum pertusum]
MKSVSSLEIAGRHCSCSKHHHQPVHECGCCLRIKAHPFYKSIEANVCFNASLVPSPLALDVFMTWNKHELFNKTISAASPPPICFGIPHLKVAKACVKFSKVSIKKGHTGACAALELKALRTEKDIPLGCFYFKGEEGQGLDQGTFLDTESLVSLLEDIFQASTEKWIDNSNSLSYTPYKGTLDDDVTELVTDDKASCQCAKAPPHCDCCAEFKVFRFKVTACVHGDVDESDTGFNVAVIINGFTVFKKHISVHDPPPICKEFKISSFKVTACIKLTNVSLTPGHAGRMFGAGRQLRQTVLGMFLHGPPGYQGIA